MLYAAVVLICVLSILSLILTFGVEISINIVEPDGNTEAKSFSYNPSADARAAQADPKALKQAVITFCNSLPFAPDYCIPALYQSCETILRNEHEELVLSLFVDDYINMVCGEVDEVTKDPKDAELLSIYEKCINSSRAMSRSVKLYHAFTAIYDLYRTMEDTNTALVNLPINWRKGIEGHSFMFYGKVDFMQQIADDPRVETICEVGFNMGHSAINWMTSNPRASLLAFDLTRQLYTSAAINALYDMYPNRTISLITGNSLHSIPNYVAQFKLNRRMQQESQPDNIPKCNLIFIDGAHEYELAMHDMINMRLLANKTFHRVLIDDGMAAGVSRAWREVSSHRSRGGNHSGTINSSNVHTNNNITPAGEAEIAIEPILEIDEIRVLNQTLCLSANRIVDKDGGTDHNMYKFTRIKDEECDYDLASDYMQDSMVLGHYVW